MGSTEIKKSCDRLACPSVFFIFALVQIVFPSRYREGRYRLEGDHSNLPSYERKLFVQERRQHHPYMALRVSQLMEAGRLGGGGGGEEVAVEV